MLQFKSPKLSDKTMIDKILNSSDAEGCGFSFGNLYLWQKEYDMQFCIEDSFLFISSSLGVNRAYACPVGSGNLKEALLKVCRHAENNGIHPIFYAITEKQKVKMEEALPGTFFFCDERDYYDYIYLTENLAELSGRKYHGKRNHIAKFKKLYDCKYEKITDSNISDCKFILDEWHKGKFSDRAEDGEAAAETDVAYESIRLFKELGYEGGILYADGKPCAYSMGEPLNDSVFCTHIEKALPEYREAYSVINCETAKALLGKYTYINREDDAGDEGLRKAKLSYYPDILLVKYAASYHSDD